MKSNDNNARMMIRVAKIASIVSASVIFHPVTAFTSPVISTNTQQISTGLYVASDDMSSHLPQQSVGLLGTQMEAYERKNASRRKFGLNPISVEEFLSIEKQIAQLDNEVKSKAAAAAAAMAAFPKKDQNQNRNMFKKLFDGVLGDTCDSNWDCERPKVCCDMGYRKMCCANGRGIIDGVSVDKYTQRQLQRVPIRIPQDDMGEYLN